MRGAAGPAEGPARVSAVPLRSPCSGDARSSASGLSSGSPESRALGKRHNRELGGKHSPSFCSASTPAQLHGGEQEWELTGAARFGLGTGLLPHPSGEQEPVSS